MAFRLMTALAAAFLVAGPAATQAMGNQTDELAAELKHHYRLATPRLGVNGEPIFNPGTVLHVRKEGIVAFGEKDASYAALCPAQYREGVMYTAQSASCTNLAPKSWSSLKLFEPVCVTALDVQESLDTIAMHLATCVPNLRIRPSVISFATVIFHFSQGSLAKSSAVTIEARIDQVLSVRRHATAPVPPTTGGAVAKTVPAVGPVAGQSTKAGIEASAKVKDEAEKEKPGDALTSEPAQPAVPGADCTAVSTPLPAKLATAAETPGSKAQVAAAVAKGQTIDQVRAVLGSPQHAAEIDSKVIYIYPRLKVVFIDGIVSEIISLDPRESGERHDVIQ